MVVELTEAVQDARALQDVTCSKHAVSSARNDRLGNESSTGGGVHFKTARHLLVANTCQLLVKNGKSVSRPLVHRLAG